MARAWRGGDGAPCEETPEDGYLGRERAMQGGDETPCEETPEEWLERWRAEMRRQPGAWVERLRRLADACEDGDGGDTAAACDEIEPLMEMYLGNPMQMVDFGALHMHLGRCEACQEKMRLMQAMVKGGEQAGMQWREEQDEQTEGSGEAWEVAPRAQVREPGRGVTVRLGAALVARLCQQPASVGAWAVREDGDTITLMADTLVVGAEEWRMEVRATREADGSVRARVQLGGDARAGMQVALRWGEARREGVTGPDGALWFEGLKAIGTGGASAAVVVEVRATTAE